MSGLATFIQPLPTQHSLPPLSLLEEYRAHFRRLSWANDTPDTPIAPVYSNAGDVADLENQLSLLFMAHLKVVAAVDERLVGDAVWMDYVRRYRLIRDFHMDWPVIGAGEMIAPDTLRSRAALPMLYGRPDIVVGDKGPRVVETNFETSIAGFDEPDDIWRIAAELFSPDPSYLATGRPIPGLAEYFEERAGAQLTQYHWLMKDDARVRGQYEWLLRELNARSTHARHELHCAGDAVLPGESRAVEYLHRACGLLTVNRDRARFATTLKQLAPRLRGCTVPVALSHIESKFFLAWLSDPAAQPTALTDDERTAIANLVPWTRLVGLLSGSDLQRVRQHRGEFVIKKTDSHQALDVFCGFAMTQDNWSALLDATRIAPEMLNTAPNMWIVQERVVPRKYRLLEFTDNGAVERRAGLSCNPYVLGGRIRGFETWLLPDIPSPNAILESQFVPHFTRS